jgi:hypothetical protein
MPMKSGMATIRAWAAAAAVAAVLLSATPWFVVPATAQDSGGPAGESGADAGAADETNDATAGEAAEDAADGLTEEEERLSDLVGADEEGASGDYQQEEDDDDFVPTQEVSSDQSVNFPVDI